MIPRLILTALLALSAVLAAVTIWTMDDPPDSPLSRPVPLLDDHPTLSPQAVAAAQPAPAVLIGAGDISVCGSVGDSLTAALVERLLARYPQALVFTAGDNVQTGGEIVEYYDCFDPTWGRFRERIRPSPGNHDWFFDQGSAYLAYFGGAAGDNGQGYYSYDLGSWHIVSLNSNCDVEDCGEQSAQADWLRGDLETNAAACTLLYWHHPLWNSGTVPVLPGVETLWNIASDGGGDVTVHGHDHHYERFAPLDRDGRVDPEAGTRSFIIGTGGAWLFELGQPLEITQARDNATLGVIVFFLYPGRYEWIFVPADGGMFTDWGAGNCS